MSHTELSQHWLETAVTGEPLALISAIGPEWLVPLVGVLVFMGLAIGGNPDEAERRPLARDAVLEGIEAGLVVLDADGTILDTNDRARRLLGVGEQPLVGSEIGTFDPALAAAIDQSSEDSIDVDATATATVASRIDAIEEAANAAWLVTLRDRSTVPDGADHPAASAIEAIDDPIFATDDAGRFRFVNESFTDIFGGNPDAIAGMHLSVAVDDDVAERLVDRAVNASTDSLPEAVTFDVTAIDGTEQTIEARLAAFDGGVLGHLRDVTAIRQRRRELDRYRNIVEAISEPAGTVDGSGQFTYVNESLIRTSGYPESMLVEHGLNTIMKMADVRETEALVERLREEDERRGTVETDLITRDGDVIPVELECSLLTDEATGDGFACVFRDMSTKRERKSDLQQYETIVEGLADPVWTVNLEGGITFVNAAFESKAGHRRDRVARGDLDLVDIVTPDDVERLRSIVRELVDGDRDGQATVELDLLTDDDREIPVEMNITPLPDSEDPDARFRGVATVARDVTDRRRRQEVLTVTNRVLRHNLRTHANMISGYADMLGEVATDDGSEEYITRINESTDWLSKLGETLRDLQQAVEQNRTPSEPLAAESVETLVASYASQYPDVEIDTTIDTDELIDAGPAISRAVEQVLENAIVHNDADDPTVSVTVDSADEDGWLAVTIADNGPGIPDTERAVVLGETEVTQLQHGSGIGLWATRWLVQTVGGEIEIDDNEPRGTIVTLRLPTTAQGSE